MLKVLHNEKNHKCGRITEILTTLSPKESKHFEFYFSLYKDIPEIHGITQETSPKQHFSLTSWIE